MNEAEIIFDNVALSIRRLRSAKRNRLSTFYTQWGNCNTPFSPANNEVRHQCHVSDRHQLLRKHYHIQNWRLLTTPSTSHRYQIISSILWGL